jgi:hypothetical protein
MAVALTSGYCDCSLSGSGRELAMVFKKSANVRCLLVPGRLSLSQPFHPQTLVLVHLPPSGSILSLPEPSKS